ncbi:hypothetical protein AAFF_G00352120 [Aldrovandia affinis]|uniref:Uncharacterized protein n=1 Tax=Aldrovandia affinis TaxID=143900 RepID=A0AAD7WNR1_9TELE|nr:hypothetical protein AAFF_G00352120 [Aldrovandia affinis]
MAKRCFLVEDPPEGDKRMPSKPTLPVGLAWYGSLLKVRPRNVLSPACISSRPFVDTRSCGDGPRFSLDDLPWTPADVLTRVAEGNRRGAFGGDGCGARACSGRGAGWTSPGGGRAPWRKRAQLTTMTSPDRTMHALLLQALQPSWIW